MKENIIDNFINNIVQDRYLNYDLKLPVSRDRIWYEADINYTGGKRNRERILYSNDGLIFVTYDHYQTFYEITP